MRTERAYSGEQCAPWPIAGGGKLRPGPARDTLLPFALSPPAVRAGGGGAGITPAEIRCDGLSASNARPATSSDAGR